MEVKVLSIADDGKISLSIKKRKMRPRRPHHKSNQNKPPQQKAEDF